MPYFPYQRFIDENELNDFKDRLSQNAIDFQLDRVINPSQTFEVTVNLQKKDFLRVDEIELNYAKSIISTIPENYYVFSFSNEELLSIIKKKDLWSKLDYVLAGNILEKRGVHLNESSLLSIENQRLDELAKEDKSPRFWIIFGYLFAFLGGLIGVIVGRYISKAKRVLPNGEEVFVYSEKDRKHGERIYLIAAIFLITGLILRILGVFTFEL